MPHKVATLRSWYDEVWTKGNVTAISTFLTPTARTRGIIGEMPFAAEDLADLVPMIREQLGPIEITLPVSVEQDEWLSAQVEVKSNALHSGNPVHIFGQVITRFEQDKIAEIYSCLDWLALFEQLGLLPENAMAMMLTGTRLQ